VADGAKYNKVLCLVVLFRAPGDDVSLLKGCRFTAAGTPMPTLDHQPALDISWNLRSDFSHSKRPRVYSMAAISALRNAVSVAICLRVIAIVCR
jgi:hypothetical protein